MEEVLRFAVVNVVDFRTGAIDLPYDVNLEVRD